MTVDLLNQHTLKLTTETVDDVYLMGRLAVKLKARVFPADYPQREMECQLSDVLKLAAE